MAKDYESQINMTVPPESDEQLVRLHELNEKAKGLVKIAQGVENAGKTLMVDKDGNVEPQNPADPDLPDLSPFIKRPTGTTAAEAAQYITTQQNHLSSVFIIDPTGPGGFVEGVRMNKNRGASAWWAGQVIGGRAGSVREVDSSGDGGLAASATIGDPEMTNVAVTGDRVRPAAEMPGAADNIIATREVSPRGTYWLSSNYYGDLLLSQTSSTATARVNPDTGVAESNTIAAELATMPWSEDMTAAEKDERNKIFVNRTLGNFNPGNVNLRADSRPGGAASTDAQSVAVNPTGPRRSGNSHWMCGFYARRSDGQVWLSGHPVHYPSLNGEVNRDVREFDRLEASNTVTIARAIQNVRRMGKNVKIMWAHFVAGGIPTDVPQGYTAGSTLFLTLDFVDGWTLVTCRSIRGAGQQSSQVFMRTLSNAATAVWIENAWRELTEDPITLITTTQPTPAVPGNGIAWTGNRIVTYRRNNQKFTKIQGALSLTGGIPTSNDTVLFTLPAGSRTARTLYLPCSIYSTEGSYSKALAGVLSVRTDGVIAMHRWPTNAVGTALINLTSAYAFIDIEFESA